jgi:hypothetical protein
LKAEIEYKPPTLAELPGLTTPAAGAAAQPELPSTVAQAQPQVASGVTPVPALAPTPGQGVPQLPQATLSKAQQLNLLRERFLRGEVTEETYNKLRTEIETPGDEGETVEDISLEGEGEDVTEGVPPAPPPLVEPTPQPPAELETSPSAPVTSVGTELSQPAAVPDEGHSPVPQPESQISTPNEEPQDGQPQPKVVPKIKDIEE